SACAASGGDDPGPGPGGVGFAGREDRRVFGETLSAGRTVEGAIGRRRLQGGSWRCAAPAEPLYVLETDRAAAGDDQLRCGGAGDFPCTGIAHENARG